MLMRTGILSVGLALSTSNSDRMSGEIKATSSESNSKQMNATQHTEMTAPVVVGCVKSFGIFRYMSKRLTSKAISKLVFPLQPTGIEILCFLMTCHEMKLLCRRCREVPLKSGRKNLSFFNESVVFF